LFFSIVFLSVLVFLTLSWIWFVWTILPSKCLAGPCLNDAYVEELVSTCKDQLLQDPLTFKQNSSYELFRFFSLYFLVSFSLFSLVVYPDRDHLVTTVLTHSTRSSVARHSLVELKVPLNTNQTYKQTPS